MNKSYFENCYLKPGKNHKPIEAEIASIWIDEEEGILYSASKGTVKRSEKNIRQYFETMKKNIPEKMFIIADVNEMKTYSTREAEIMMNEIQQVCKALAVLVCKPLGKMMATVTFIKSKPAFPVKMFEDIKTARAWIMELKAKEKSKKN
jgi:hypothetical protein